MIDAARANTVFKNAEQGAATSVWCATSHQLNGMGGVYCENCDIARALPSTARLEVLPGTERPSGWTGKLWALKQGIVRACGERPPDCFWFTDAEAILGVRVRCDPAIELQVFRQDSERENHQIRLLRRDLGDTPLDWKVREIGVGHERPEPARQPAGRALLVFPFDPHSLIMAALSDV